MGLIQMVKGAAEKAIKGTITDDQFKKAIRCEDLGNDILMLKKTAPSGRIPNGSTIIVAPGQCAVIFDNGRVIDATAEDGLYQFDESSTPSFFAGQFGEVFKEMWQRFTYGGEAPREQAVYFFNTKEIMDNKFGTQGPVPFQDWSHAIPNQMTGTLTPMRLKIMCHGKYTFRISNPAVFMNEIAGTADIYRKDKLIEQMRSEVISSFQNVLNELGNSTYKVPALELPSQTDKIKEMMDERVFDEPIRRRGISIVGFTVAYVAPDEESEAKIDSYELSANNHMQQGKLVDAYSNAVQDAAKNANGAANGFIGVGMMNMASNGIIGGATTGPWQNAQTVPQQNMQPETTNKQQTALNGWECPKCKNHVEGNFCPNCGTKKPEEQKEKFCSKCGAKLTGGAKFCPECGEKVE